MTVKEFTDGLQATGNKEFAEEMKSVTNIWSNTACKGYCAAAMRKAGYSREQIAGVLKNLSEAFEDISVSEAEGQALNL